MPSIPDVESTLALLLVWVGIPGGIVAGVVGILQLFGWVDLGQSLFRWGRDVGDRIETDVQGGLAHPFGGAIGTLLVSGPTLLLWAIASQITSALFGLVPGASISPPGLDLSIWHALLAPQNITPVTQWVIGAGAVSTLVLVLARLASKAAPVAVIAGLWVAPWFLLTIMGLLGFLLTAFVGLVALLTGGSSVGVENVVGWLTLSLTLFIAAGTGVGLAQVALPDDLG